MLFDAVKTKTVPIVKLLKQKKNRKGAIAIMLVFAIGIAANTVATGFYEKSVNEFSAARVTSEGFRARQMALAGFQAGLSALRTVPEEYLFQTGLALNPPDIQVSDECQNCFVKYRIQPEDGKINLNQAVLTFEDSPNETYKSILQRLFFYYKIPVENIDTLIDWIDENDVTESRGAESSYYSGLEPPRKIKNYRMFSLSEVVAVKGFDYNMIYASKAPEGWLEEREELAFLTDDEKNLIQPEDWIPANNLTAYIPVPGDTGRININTARFHVIMSLSDSMTKQAVLELFRLRRQKGGYIKDINDLKTLPSFQVQTAEGITLYDEIAGQGGELTSIIKAEGEVYRVIGVGSILPRTDNDKSGAIVRRVTGLYDRKNGKLLYYKED